MNTAEFIEYWSKINGTSNAESEYQIKQFINTFKSAVSEHGKLDIRGFASAEIITRIGGERRNPRNQQQIKTKDKRLVRIKISPKFKNMLEE